MVRPRSATGVVLTPVDADGGIITPAMQRRTAGHGSRGRCSLGNLRARSMRSGMGALRCSHQYTVPGATRSWGARDSTSCPLSIIHARSSSASTLPLATWAQGTFVRSRSSRLACPPPARSDDACRDCAMGARPRIGTVSRWPSEPGTAALTTPRWGRVRRTLLRATGRRLWTISVRSDGSPAGWRRCRVGAGATVAQVPKLYISLERETGFEPATLCLGSRCSTN